MNWPRTRLQNGPRGHGATRSRLALFARLPPLRVADASASNRFVSRAVNGTGTRPPVLTVGPSRRCPEDSRTAFEY